MNPVTTDRAAAVRQAVRRLVADHGLHGASMAAVAKAAGVATGTAYVHYASKEELLIAAYVELKADLGATAVVDLDAGAPPEARFRSIWSAVHAFLAEDPTRARFLVQVEASPLARTAHDRALLEDDPLVAQVRTPDLAARLRPLPLEVLWDLGLGPAVRLAATEQPLTAAQRAEVADACWQAVTT